MKTDRETSTRRAPRLAMVVALACVLAACGGEGPAAGGIGTRPPGAPRPVTTSRLVAADSEPHNWLGHGRTRDEQRHSPLDQIDQDTVARLGLTWSFDFDLNRGLSATPLVNDGVLYTTTGWSILYAFDAATGELLWRYDPQVPGQHARFACCDVINRGPALYRDKVYAGTLDGRLVAVDAATGRLKWETRTTPEGSAYTITGAPRVAGGRIIIGNGGAEFGVRGYVSAYDAETGELLWRTYTVPGDPSQPFESEALRQAAETWTGKWWVAGGGGTAWDSMLHDPDLDLVYVGVGNGSPWYQRLRSPGGGDNLYLASILALDAGSGELLWHYQTTPGDNWDYTATQPLMLADLTIDGRVRKVIMQAPKNGFFYVLDRETGEFLSASAFAETTWATGIDEHGRPIELAEARALDGLTLVRPSDLGAHNWHPMAFNPGTGWVYFPVYDLPGPHAVDDGWVYTPGAFNAGIDFAALIEMAAEGGLEDLAGAGRLVAWAPVRNREVWRVEHPLPVSGGVLSTAGNLVFQGRADGRLRAYRATDGAVLWEFDGGRGIAAAPISYAVDGVQYVAVMAGWGGAGVLLGLPDGQGKVGNGRLLAFRLDGDAQIDVSEAPPPPPVPVPTVALDASPGDIAEGALLYARSCTSCHGIAALGNGVIPDLRRSDAATHALFSDIVLGGALAARGMPAFDDLLTPDQVRAIQAYVLTRAREDAGP